MNKTIFAILITVLARTSFAYEDGSYDCNYSDYPVVTVKSIELSPGITVPYVEFKGPNKAYKGIAIISESNGLETLQLPLGPNSLKVGFQNNLSLCKKIN